MNEENPIGVKQILVHHIIEGPYHSWDVTDDIDGDYEGDFYFCLAKVEAEGGVSDEEIRFDNFGAFYEMRKHLDSTIEPYVLEAEAFE